LGEIPIAHEIKIKKKETKHHHHQEQEDSEPLVLKVVTKANRSSDSIFAVTTTLHFITRHEIPIAGDKSQQPMKPTLQKPTKPTLFKKKIIN
jgi:hypothetical protein